MTHRRVIDALSPAGPEARHDVRRQRARCEGKVETDMDASAPGAGRSLITATKVPGQIFFMSCKDSVVSCDVMSFYSFVAQNHIKPTKDCRHTRCQHQTEMREATSQTGNPTSDATDAKATEEDHPPKPFF